MTVLLCGPRVKAVAVMIANITRLDSAIPVNTSKRLLRVLSLAPRMLRRQRDGVVSSGVLSAHLLDPVGGLPEEQVRRDRGPQHRDQR
jgi:hypothetical protein